MRVNEETALFAGPAGPLEVIVENPGAARAARGIALVCHPHPLFGGNNTNKVTQTLARTFTQLGYVALRPNFRGVGQSAGKHDKGDGETADMLAVIAEARRRFGELPVVLAGFSFGAFVQTCVGEALAQEGHPAERLVLVGTASGEISGDRRYAPGRVAENTLVIHGSADETVPLANVLAWAQGQDLPVVVVAGADHFFHRRLHVIRGIVARAWPPR
jgi:alpha/beta superfamily hydrolase